MSEMSKSENAPEAQVETSFLDQALEATAAKSNQDHTKELLTALAESAVQGTVKWDRNLTKTINSAIEEIDKIISKQMSAVLHDEKFQALEGSWRGLNGLVNKTQSGPDIQIEMMNITKKELAKDLTKSGVDKSMLNRRVYDDEYGTAGGSPFAAIIGDFEFSNDVEDVDLLKDVSKVCASAFCPFISAASSDLFGLEDFTKIKDVNNLKDVFQSRRYASWNSFRESEESRFVCLTMPHVLARTTYGINGKSIERFNFQEFEVDEAGHTLEENHNDYCWSNAAYAMGANLTRAHEKYGWCTTIRGKEGGGLVNDLPIHAYTNKRGEEVIKAPTEIELHEGEEKSLSDLGFMPLVYYKDTDYAYFPGAQTCQKPKVYDDEAANANAKLGARLPYIMATSRIAHYLKVMARDKVGSHMEASNMQSWLTEWIGTYTNINPDADAEMKAQYPLREAKVEVAEVPGQPGVYNAVAWLRPWLQMEELNASLRLVASLPSGKD